MPSRRPLPNTFRAAARFPKNVVWGAAAARRRRWVHEVYSVKHVDLTENTIAYCNIETAKP